MRRRKDDWICNMIMIITNDLMTNLYDCKESEDIPLGQIFQFSRGLMKWFSPLAVSARVISLLFLLNIYPD
jgi:hypothetical protein